GDPASSPDAILDQTYVVRPVVFTVPTCVHPTGGVTLGALFTVAWSRRVSPSATPFGTAAVIDAELTDAVDWPTNSMSWRAGGSDSSIVFVWVSTAPLSSVTVSDTVCSPAASKLWM